MAMLCCAASLCFCSLAANPPADITVLKADSGINLSLMNRTLALSPSYGSAQAVKFTAPRPGWTLKSIMVMATDGWNESTNQLPSPLPFAIEVRDEDLRLLYHYADTQLPYFTSGEGIRMANIEVPDLILEGDFFICFYGYLSIALATELQNATGSSYIFDKQTETLYTSGVTPPNSSQTFPVNWLIRAAGQ